MIQRYDYVDDREHLNGDGDFVLYADHLAALAEKDKEIAVFAAKVQSDRDFIFDLSEQIAALVDEIAIQDQMLRPGDGIHERTVDGVDICVLQKDLWEIKSKREAQAINEQIAVLSG